MDKLIAYLFPNLDVFDFVHDKAWYDKNIYVALTYLQNTHLNFIITAKPTFSYINTELLAEKLAYVLADAFDCMSGFISQLIDAVEQHMALVTIMTAALILKHTLIQRLCSTTFVLTWNELTIGRNGCTTADKCWAQQSKAALLRQKSCRYYCFAESYSINLNR